jgi:hypothetical protein
MLQRTVHARLFFGVAVMLVMFCTAFTNAMAATSQIFTLRPGWNAVYLEVQPAVTTPAEVFKNLPVESVWTWYGRTSSMQFIRDPSEGLLTDPGWSVYSPSPDKAAAVNLFAIFANRAFLIKLGGTQSVTWTVTGTPATTATTWIPDSYNFVGFHVDPAAPPTFDTYFAASPSHKGQPVYRLSSQGKWELVATPAATATRSGEAYWVYCKGASSYQGPLSIPLLDALDFGTNAVMKAIILTNNDATRTLKATVTYQPAADWFTYQSYNATSGFFEYLRLDSKSIDLAPGRQTNLWLAVRRELMSKGTYQGTLQITDDLGSRFRIPVSAEK